jgi:hypothetical protein
MHFSAAITASKAVCRPRSGRAVLFYPNATGCSLRATPSFQTWQILDLNGGNSWWLALNSNVQNRQARAFTFRCVEP